MERGIVVYRSGTKTTDSLTPRERDLVAAPGSNAGLSVNANPTGSRQKVQKIDVSLLTQGGLKYLPDDPSVSDHDGHGVITPVDSAGKVDQEALREWASSRGTGVTHRLTQAVLDAIVE